MPFWKRKRKKNSNSVSAPTSAPTPTPYIEQLQKLQEVDRKLEADREKYLQSLKNAARNLMDRTRKYLNDTLSRDNADVLEFNSILKQKDMEFNEYINKIKEIKKALTLIAKGEYQKIIHLKHNSLFLEIFPNFDFITFAAHAGKPDLINHFNNKNVIKSLQTYDQNYIMQELEIKKKKEAAIKYQNLNPNFKPLLDRPRFERVTAVFAYNNYYQIDNDFNKLCNSIECLKKYWGFNLESGYPQKELMISNETIFVDNLSRIVQSLINQFFDNCLPDPKKDRKELIQVLAMGLLCILFYQRINYQPNSADYFKNYKNYNFIDPTRLLFAGLVRVLSENGKYGEDIGTLIADAKNLYFLPICVDIFKICEPVFDLNSSFYHVKSNGITEINEDIFLVKTFDQIMISGKYPIGDFKILQETRQKLIDISRKNEIENLQKMKSFKFINTGLLYSKLFEEFGAKGINSLTCPINISEFYNNTKLNEKENKESKENNETKENKVNREIKENIESILLSQITELYIHLLINRNIKQPINAALSILGIMIKEKNSNISETNLNKKIQSTFMGALARLKLKAKYFTNIQCIVFYNTHIDEAIEYFNKFLNYEKLTKLSFSERHKKEVLKSLNLDQDDVQIADLMIAYLESSKQTKMTLDNPKLLVKALEHIEKIKKDSQIKTENNQTEKKHSSEQSFNNIPNIIEPGQSIKLDINQKAKYRIVTPEVLAHEAEQGNSIFDIQQKQLAESINAKIKSKINTEVFLLEAPKLDSSKLLSNHSQYHSESYSFSVQGLGLTFASPQNPFIENTQTQTSQNPQSNNQNNNQSHDFKIYEEGQYILECIPDQFDLNSEIQCKSFQVRHRTLFNTKIPASYECGNYCIEFKEPTSGTFTIKQGKNVKTQICVNANKFELTLDKPGLVEITLQLKENAAIIEHYQVHVYAKPSINANNSFFAYQNQNQNLIFTFKNEKLAYFSNGRLELHTEDNINKINNENINSEYQKTSHKSNELISRK